MLVIAGFGQRLNMALFPNLMAHVVLSHFVGFFVAVAQFKGVRVGCRRVCRSETSYSAAGDAHKGCALSRREALLCWVYWLFGHYLMVRQCG